MKQTCWARPGGVYPPSAPFLAADTTPFDSGGSTFNLSDEHQLMAAPLSFDRAAVEMPRSPVLVNET